MSTATQQTMTTQEKVELLNQLTQELYEGHNRRLRVMYPWVMVRVCKKARQIGPIITPERQNKPVHEGIVIATWKPFTEELGYIDKDGVKVTRVIERRSQLMPGDHVLFPHFAGAPLEGFDKDCYRVVREVDWDESRDGGIFCVVDYAEREESPREQLREMLEEITDVNQASLFAAKIEASLLLIDRETPSVTLSGR